MQNNKYDLVLEKIRDIVDLHEEIKETEERIKELENILNTIQLFVELGPDKRVYLKLGKEFSLPVKSTETDKIILEIGDGVHIEVTAEDAIEILSEELGYKETYLDYLYSEIDKLYKEIEEILKGDDECQK
jgi:prefoldin subunit 5